jgi:hypothetical protein
VIFRVFSGVTTRLWVVLVIITSAWNIVTHDAQPSLPRMLFGNTGTQALYSWMADCPSLLQVCERERIVLEGLNLHPVAVPSPDGKYTAVYMAEAWMIYQTECLLEATACAPIPLDATANDTRIAWGPDGSTIAYMTSAADMILRIRTRGCWDGSTARACLNYHVPLRTNSVMRQPTWSADGRRLAMLGLIPRGLFVWDTACLDDPQDCIYQSQYVPVNMRAVSWPSLSADGSKLLYQGETADGLEHIYLTDIETAVVEQVSFGEGGGSVPAWSSDGRYIAYAGFRRRSSGDLGIYLLDRERQISIFAIHLPGQDFSYPSWNRRP